MSVAEAGFHRGHIAEADIVEEAKGKWKMKALRIVSTKSAIAARIDAAGTSKNGSEGKKLKDQILVRLDKIRAPQMPKLQKVLPKPDDAPRRKRGGKKFRKQREKYAQTLQRKYMN